ncbi:MAG: mechanosensitive ion channel family protein [Acutalibacteraceae bacterium]
MPIKNLLTLTASTTAASESILELITSGNIILDENGQFVDPSQAVSNFTSWWEKLDIVNRIIDKIPSAIVAVLLIFIGLWLSRVISNLAVKAMKANKVDPSVYNFIKRSISVLIKAIFVLSALSMFFNISSFITALGAAGVAASLGLQNSVAQFASGIQILFNHPFKNGDFVEINGIQGNVADIRFMNTVLTTIDNKRIIVPNSHITTNHIINYSAENKRRVDLTFSIGYSENIAKAKEVILSVVNSNELILKDPVPQVFVASHEASSINLIVKLWCDGANYWDVFYQMQEDVKLAFDENNISIPYNQLDVHIKKEEDV